MRARRQRRRLFSNPPVRPVDFFSSKCSGSLDFITQTSETGTEPKQTLMKTIIDHKKLEEVKAVAEAATPNAPLKGQAEIAKLLRTKGYSIRAISRFLGEHGLAVSTTAITNYFRQEETTSTK